MINLKDTLKKAQINFEYPEGSSNSKDARTFSMYVTLPEAECKAQEIIGAMRGVRTFSALAEKHSFKIGCNASDGKIHICVRAEGRMGALAMFAAFQSVGCNIEYPHLTALAKSADITKVDCAKRLVRREGEEDAYQLYFSSYSKDRITGFMYLLAATAPEIAAKLPPQGFRGFSGYVLGHRSSCFDPVVEEQLFSKAEVQKLQQITGKQLLPKGQTP